MSEHPSDPTASRQPGDASRMAKAILDLEIESYGVKAPLSQMLEAEKERAGTQWERLAKRQQLFAKQDPALFPISFTGLASLKLLLEQIRDGNITPSGEQAHFAHLQTRVSEGYGILLRLIARREMRANAAAGRNSGTFDDHSGMQISLMRAQVMYEQMAAAMGITLDQDRDRGGRQI